MKIEFPVKDVTYDEVGWCFENFGWPDKNVWGYESSYDQWSGQYFYKSVWFVEETDAMAFKLRWA
jgi:hypothetical protein